MDVAERISSAAPSLSTAERRVAEIVLSNPQLVAFGTVAALAAASNAGAATVVRLAAKIGFTGFTDLQEAIQDELAQRLRPAAQRIREGGGGRLADLLARTATVEAQNVRDTMAAINDADFERVVGELAAASRSIVVVACDAARGVATQFAHDLSQLREGVTLLDGTPVAVGRRLALAGPSDVVITIDLQRYDTWVLDAVRRLGGAGADVISVTDSRLSPLAASAIATFVVSAEAAGPFDSYVATLAQLGALTAGVADRLRHSAGERLDRMERMWQAMGALD